MLQIQCPQCSASFGFKPEWAGRKLQCTKCGHIFVAPDAEPAPELPIEDVIDRGEDQAAIAKLVLQRSASAGSTDSHKTTASDEPESGGFVPLFQLARWLYVLGWVELTYYQSIYDTTVGEGTDRVHNYGLLCNRLCGCVGAGAILVCGVVLYSSAHRPIPLIDRIIIVLVSLLPFLAYLVKLGTAVLSE